MFMNTPFLHFIESVLWWKTSWTTTSSPCCSLWDVIIKRSIILRGNSNECTDITISCSLASRILQERGTLASAKSSPRIQPCMSISIWKKFAEKWRSRHTFFLRVSMFARSLATVNNDVLEHILSFCDLPALSSIAQTNHFFQTSLRSFTSHISKRRAVISALNRMALERMFFSLFLSDRPRILWDNRRRQIQVCTLGARRLRDEVALLLWWRGASWKQRRSLVMLLQ